MIVRRVAFLGLVLLAAACDSSSRGGGGRTPPPGNPPPPPPGNTDGGTVMPPTTPCGNGVINGLEACDGTTFSAGSDCATLNLGAGSLHCTSMCTLDTAQCAVRDYCTANNLYGNMQCDACELLGGVRDPDCMTVCGADGMCGDRFDTLTNTWTCRRLGMVDPDCGMCGNGVTDGNELCDGRAFANNKFTCGDFGFLSGDLGCKADCTPNFAMCRYSVCGDGTLEGPEACEGTDFKGETCESRGFAGGNLTCTPSCTIAETACVAPGCNNGIVEPSRFETCDGANLDGATCMSLGFAGGTLSCNGTCQYETAACVSPGCGNGLIEAPNEQCEGSNLNGATCMSLGFLQGTVGCSPSSCTYDTSACIAPGCGNMIIESPTESCEGTNFNGATCVSRGFATGDLICNSSCQIETTSCVAAGCGNNIIESGEQCEGTNVNGVTCDSLGWQGGTLGCDSMCHFDQQGCFGVREFCGDGRKDALEPCDGTNFGTTSRNCGDYGAGAGTMTCNNCRLDFSPCSAGDPCAQGGWYGDGVCDLCEYLSSTGHRDTDCGDAVTDGACGFDGTCAEYFDGATGRFTCEEIQGVRDPDCGCGNSSIAPMNGPLTVEFCDGSTWAMGASQMCTSYGFTSGTVTCGMNCGPDFTNCF